MAVKYNWATYGVGVIGHQLAEAVIIYTDDGHTEKITAGATEEALAYEVSHMEAAVDGDNRICIDYTIDVMKLMTEARKEWGLRYPEEER